MLFRSSTITREISGVIVDASRHQLVPLVLIRDGQILPDAQRVCVPDGFKESTVIDDLVILVRTKNLIRAAGQLKIDGALLHNLPGNAVEHRQPGFVSTLGDAQLIAGFLCDKGLVINGILSVHGLHLGSGLVQ